MREMLPKIRTSQHGGDPLWKSEKRRRRSKTGDAVGRARCRSSFLSAPGVKFFAERGRSLDRSVGEYFRRAKVSWDGGDVAPVPRFPVSRGDRKKIQATASVPKKSVSLKGCTPLNCVQFCAHLRCEYAVDGVSLRMDVALRDRY